MRGACDRLKEMGFSDSDLARIHGPIGLAIGAVSPAEIAVSILAQMTQVLRRGEKAMTRHSALPVPTAPLSPSRREAGCHGGRHPPRPEPSVRGLSPR